MTCLLCGGTLDRPVSPEQALCAVCRALVFPGAVRLAGETCRTCRQALLGELESCIDCVTHNWSFTQVQGLFPYHSRSGELVRAYKGQARVVLAKLWAGQLAPQLEGCGVLVPVPVHRKHFRERGWDPVGLLCTALSRRAGLPIARVLRRLPTISQKKLGRGSRADNALGSYVRHDPLKKVVGRLVWLVDDVVTTGWTVEACARLLLAAGALEVRVVCLCLH